jgi:hypothetical protein
MHTSIRQPLRVHGLALVFSSPVPDHHRRLVEDYGPFFTSGDPDASAIEFTVDDGEAAAPSRPADISFLGALGDTVTVRADGSVHIRGSAIAHEKAYEAEVRAYFTATVLRELTRRRTANLFHASAVLGPRGVVAFAGAKKAGKSTLAMLCAIAGASYVSNDMTVLSLSDEAGPVSVLGLPQPITLAPGALHWFARQRPGIGLGSPAVDDTLDPTSLYTLELGDKSRVTRDLLSGYTNLRSEAAPLGVLVFPEANLTMDRPRSRLLDRDEAFVRLSMLAETFLKWHWPVAFSAEEYLERIGRIMLTAVDSVPAWHLQWCPDHDLNYDMVRDIAL